MKRIVVFALVLNAALLGVIAHQLVALAGGGPVATQNGDTNGDGSRDLTDAIYMLQWLFSGGEPPVAIAQQGGDGEGDAQLRAMVNNMFLDIEELRASSIDEARVLEILAENGYVQTGDLVSALRQFPLREEFHPVAFSGDFEELENIRLLHPVAVSGDFNDLENIPDAQGEGCCEQERSWLVGMLRSFGDQIIVDPEDPDGEPQIPWLNWTGNRARLSNHNFNEANLAGVDFRPIVESFRNCSFRNADLRGAFLPCSSGVDFRGANLAGAWLSSDNCEGEEGRGSNFEGANLQGVRLGDEWSTRYFEFANFRGVNLSGMTLQDFHLQFANLSNANLANTDLSNAHLNGADLTGASLNGANISEADFSGAIGVNFEGTIGTPAFMPNAIDEDGGGE